MRLLSMLLGELGLIQKCILKHCTCVLLYWLIRIAINWFETEFETELDWLLWWYECFIYRLSYMRLQSDFQSHTSRSYAFQIQWYWALVSTAIYVYESVNIKQFVSLFHLARTGVSVIIHWNISNIALSWYGSNIPYPAPPKVDRVYRRQGFQGYSKYRVDGTAMLFAFIYLIDIAIDTNIEVIVVSLTTWEAHHSPRAKPEGCGEFPKSLMRQQWPKLRYQFLFYHDETKLMMNKQGLSI